MNGKRLPFFIPHPSSLNFSGPAPGLRDVDGGGVAETLREAGRDGAPELTERVAADEADGRAAEAAAGHARPGHPFDAGGDLDQRVEFRAADLVVVAQR